MVALSRSLKRAAGVTRQVVPHAMARFIRYALLGAPIAFVTAFLVVPLGLSVAISFWERVGFKLQPAFSLGAYQAFFSGVRLGVFEKSFVLALAVTVIGLLVAYPIAFFLSRRVSPRASQACLFLFAVPFVINPSG